MRLSATDYEDIYSLPDHWIMHERDPDGMFPHLHAYYIGRAIQIIKASGAKTVLEVGCGDGWACAQMVKAGLTAVGIDWSGNAIGYARIKAPDATFHQSDVMYPDFAAQYPDGFDAIAMIEVLEHIPPEECMSAVTNIVQHLKPSGTFVLTTPSTNVINHNPQHYRHFDTQTVSELLNSVKGIQISSIEGYGDVKALDRQYQIMRFFNNRLYEIKPLVRAAWRRFHLNANKGPTPLDRCYGLIVTMKKVT